MDLLIIIGLLVLSAFFSASELAIFGTPLYKVKQALKNGYKFSKLLFSLKKNSERTLITILIGNNFVNVLVALFAGKIGDRIIDGIGTGTVSILDIFVLTGLVIAFIVPIVITFMILLFGEIIPKVFATKYSMFFALFASPIINFLYYLLWPIVKVLELFIKLLNKVFKGDSSKVSRDDIEVFVEDGRKQGLFSETESRIIKNLLDFHERSAESVFKHRTQVFALEDTTSLDGAIDKVLNNPYSRVPIYHNDKDNIIGIMTIRDMLTYSKDESNDGKHLGELTMRPVFRIPITAHIFDVFLEMKKTGHHFAIVIDEYGGTAGIITFEDILEEMVGDIKDETDQQEEKEIVKLNGNSLIIKGDVLLREILQEYHIDNFNMPEEFGDKLGEEDEISYIILTALKDFANKGDVVKLGNLSFKVIDVNKKQNSIQKVKVDLIK